VHVVKIWKIYPIEVFISVLTVATDVSTLITVNISDVCHSLEYSPDKSVTEVCGERAMDAIAYVL
jgi:hypothetical protein